MNPWPSNCLADDWVGSVICTAAGSCGHPLPDDRIYSANRLCDPKIYPSSIWRILHRPPTCGRHHCSFRAGQTGFRVFQGKSSPHTFTSRCQRPPLWRHLRVTVMEPSWGQQGQSYPFPTLEIVEQKAVTPYIMDSRYPLNFDYISRPVVIFTKSNCY